MPDMVICRKSKQQQPCERKNMTKILYESLQREADEILMYDEDYNINARLGLTILIYYTGGGSVAGQRKTLEAAERFYSKYHGYLKMHFWTDMRRFARLNPTAFQNKIDRTIKNAESGRRLECVLTSDTEYGQRAPEYQFKTLSSHPIDENGLSCLQITLPLSFLSTPVQQQEFEDWVEYVCKQFDIFHGYAGLTIALPDSYYKYQFYEYAVTKRYWGVTPDSDSPITLLWYEGIKSISWYTLVGKAFQNKLNSMEIQNVLTHYPDITLKTYNGTMVFKAGKFPDLGDKTKPLPVNYLVVNNLMRPILTQKLNDSLHTAFGNGKNRYSASQGYYWLHRWDNANFENGIFDPKGTKQELMPVYRERPLEAPYAGMWIPDDLENAIERHFEEGEVFPDRGEYYKHLLNGTTEIRKGYCVWRLVKRGDGGSVLQASEF